MLGHIFENLLEDNKDKGAYYTPKEIVHYMCQESLIEYLTTWFENKGYEVTGYIGFDKPDQPKLFSANEGRKGQLVIETDNKTTGKQIDRILIEKLLKKKLDDVDNKLIKKHSTEFHTALDSVKICDPAIGSGAFPMGLLHEIFTAKQTLHTFEHGNTKTFDASGVKLNIIQNSIYGVDIEKGAVDIARLRFWLSLIVDEEKPKALPNLDYKIVVGNSLVSKLGDDIIDIDWTLNETSHGLFGADLAKQKGDLLKKISKEQKEFFSPDSDKKKLVADIRKLKIDLLITQLELMISTKGIEKQPTGSGATITKQTEIYLKTSGWKSTVKELQKLKAKSDSPLQYFDWKLDFPEVMNEQVAFNVGFDIVIGNPPYVGHKGGMKDLFRNLKDTPLGKKFNNERMDVFYYFFHLSINLSNDKGIIGFITTNYYLTADSAVKLRKDFKERSRIIKLVNFNELKVFESAMGQHNIMTFLTKNIERKSCSIININKKGFADSEHINRILENQDSDTLYYKQNNQDLFDGDKCYIRLQNSTITSLSNSNVILEKIKASKELLGKYCNISQGIVTGIDKVGPKHILRQKEFVENKGDGIYVVSQAEKSSIGNSKLIKPWFKNSDIKRYFVAEKPTKWLIHTSVEVNLVDYPNIEEHLTYFKKLITGRNYESGELSKAKRLKRWWALSSSRWEFDFDAPKIVSPQRSYSNTFAYTEKSWYASADVYFISEKENGLSLKYLLGILNSRLIYFWLYNRGKRKGEMLELYLTPISEIPIKKPGRIELKIIEDLVNEILTSKKNNPTLDTTKIEIKIDNLVYKLYELTYDEVKIIDPEFSLSKKEYEAIKLE
jgi:adenine-specific DNA-methyltransferase